MENARRDGGSLLVAVVVVTRRDLEVCERQIHTLWAGIGVVSDINMCFSICGGEEEAPSIHSIEILIYLSEQLTPFTNYND